MQSPREGINVPLQEPRGFHQLFRLLIRPWSTFIAKENARTTDSTPKSRRMATTEETEDPPHTLNENDGKNFAIATYPAWDMIDGIFRPTPELKRRGLVVIESHKKRMNPGLVNLHRSLEDTIVLPANNEPKGKNGWKPLQLQQIHTRHGGRP